MSGRATARVAPPSVRTPAPARLSGATARTTADRTSAARTSTARTSTARSAAARGTTPGTAPRTTPRTTPSRPELRLVPGAAPARRGRLSASVRFGRAPFVLLVVALLVGTTLGLLILNTAIAVDSLKATGLRAENAQRAQEVQRLEQQVVAGDAPGAIAQAAAEAGLIPAGPAGYLVIGEDGSVTLRGVAQPAGDPAAEDEDGD
jgi:hypothetical protein